MTPTHTNPPASLYHLPSIPSHALEMQPSKAPSAFSTSSLKSLAEPSPSPFSGFQKLVAGLICLIYQTIQSIFSHIKQVFIDTKQEESDHQKKDYKKRNPSVAPPIAISKKTIALTGINQDPSLTVSIHHQDQIKNLVRDLATSSIPTLAFRAHSIQKLGTTLRNKVHPFLFLATIFSDPQSCVHMKKIHQEKEFPLRGQIWRDFASNLAENFKRHSHLEKYSTSFATFLYMDLNQVENYRIEQNWEGLLIHLTETFGHETYKHKTHH